MNSSSTEDVDEVDFIGTSTKALEHSFPPLYVRTDTLLLQLPGVAILIRISNDMIIFIFLYCFDILDKDIYILLKTDITTYTAEIRIYKIQISYI